MANQLKHWLQLTMKLWQAILFAILLMAFTGTATYIVLTNTEKYQYNNIERQRALVEKRVLPIEESVRDLKYRMSDSEIKINSQIQDSRYILKKLEEQMYEAAPSVYRELAKKELNGVRQEANPTITINPVINAGK
ncbi:MULTISPECIES: hypothetical protein [Pseudomonas syringae group]|uniref:Uncharacterized protein n=3 Tax=Pseudomonas syringae group TaxID=136849 RepID=A0AAD0DZY4_9PSED|nr:MULTISPECIES: hypothetical protein [Pseudomonas syringae group]AVB21101.1 hypothetical protein BKM03_19155 [Pseudomonas avellanae]EGH10300.1 hypothetical protein PSYMP_12929 [Pseudomonas amygdali pv. morsprunorum str. M302280]KWS56207.1 hypothetical protein AL055_07515 [Pseudomonas amygdali pv. morsprunorum]PHN43014.1 hypothetical protein AO261_24615 [Pseudomonas avellanae]POC83362.1 hypothetical protein BKM26_25260 [Pseudomonas avellanae]